MKITLEMVLTRFFSEHPDICSDVSLSERLQEYTLLGIQLLPRDCRGLAPSHLYVTDVLPLHLPEKIPVLLFLSETESLVETSENLILIRSGLELADGFNALLNVYHAFQEWGRQLDFAIFRNTDFQEFIDLSENFIASPILIYDPALKLLAYSRRYPGLEDHIFQSAITNGYLDLETVQYFEKKHIFDEMDHTGSSAGEPDDFRVHADFARAINVRNELAVYCILLYTSKFPRVYVNQLFQIFCNSIENLLEKQHADFLKNRSVTDYFLMDLLENPDTPEEQIRERIYYNDLDYNGNYILISMHSDLNHGPSENYFLQLLRNNMINCRVFPYREGIVVLYHLPKFKEMDYRDYLREQLQPILKNFSGHNAMLYFSKPFSNIGQFALAYHQAENLYQMHPEKRTDIPTSPYYFYEDYWLEDLLFSLPEKSKKFSFCEPCLLQMTAENTKKSRQQLSILYEYLNCDRKLTDVAQKLQMHRNNVLYHIRQLEERYHFDLDDPKTRLKLLISFEIIKQQ